MVGDAMTSTRVDYRPADAEAAWWVAVDDGALAALSPVVSAATAATIWRGLGTGGIGAVLEALTGAFGTSLAAIPPFALAIAEPGGLRVAVRGDVEIIVEGDGVEAVSGTGVATWTERFLPGAVRATIVPAGATTAPAADVPLRSGVVRADQIRLELGASPTRVEPAVATAAASASSAASAESAAPAVGAAEPSDPEEMSDAEEPSAAAASAASAISSISAASAAPAISSSPAASSASVIDSVPPGLFGARSATAPAAASEPAETAAPVAATAAEPAPPAESESESDAAPESPPEPGVAPRADTSADTLIPEATAAEDAEPAPVDEYDLLWGETVARPVSAAAIAPVEAETDAADAAAAPGAEPGPAPSADPAAPAAAPQPGAADGADAPATPDGLGDHDGATIAVADVRAMRAERITFESTDSVPARRPARGRIRLSTGRVVELERPVVIGRRPKSTRTSGAELPTLVAVDSPEQDISRSHVEIRAEGEHVLVTDLDTTNGTVLLRGGNEPVRLHPNEPTMVVTGDVLDLGDEVTVTFEDLP